MKGQAATVFGMRHRCSTRDTCGRVHRQLVIDLTRLIRAQCSRVRANPRSDARERIDHLAFLLRLRDTIAMLDPAEPAVIVRQLLELRAELTQRLSPRVRPFHPLRSCVALAQALLSIETALEALAKLPSAGPPVLTVVVPTVLLYELRQRSMPPERMLLVAGRGDARGLMLTGCFDVTGERTAHRSYVRADNDKLAAALLVMESSGTCLGAWVHSHPGAGPGASVPSSIDVNQYADWQRDHPHLLALITTADGHVRCWGHALVSQSIRIILDGSGANQVGDDVYLLV